MRHQPIIRAFFDEPTNTVSYIVADPASRQAAVIDPVLDYDPNSGEVDTRSVEAILRVAAQENYRIVWALETHAHADHLSGSPYIKAKLLPIAALGPARLPELTGVTDLAWFAALFIVGFAVLIALQRRGRA